MSLERQQLLQAPLVGSQGRGLDMVNIDFMGVAVLYRIIKHQYVYCICYMASVKFRYNRLVFLNRLLHSCYTYIYIQI